MSNIPGFDALWDYDHPDQTERAFRDLVPQLNGDPAAQLLTQIARAQGLQGHFEQGHATLDQAAQQITSDTQTARVRLLLERGRLFNSAGQPDQARPLFEQAWELGQRNGEIGYAVDAGHMLGILEAPALDWSLKTVALAESSSDPRARRWLGSLYNNIGWTYHDRGDYDRALTMFELALTIREAQGNEKLIRIARWTVGRTLRSLGRIDEALAIQRQLAQIGGDDGYVDEELGECLLALGQAQEAKPHFAIAYEKLSKDQWLVAHEGERLERMRKLSE